jgi:hypothetical protein
MYNLSSIYDIRANLARKEDLDNQHEAFSMGEATLPSLKSGKELNFRPSS